MLSYVVIVNALLSGMRIKRHGMVPSELPEESRKSTKHSNTSLFPSLNRYLIFVSGVVESVNDTTNHPSSVSVRLDSIIAPDVGTFS